MELPCSFLLQSTRDKRRHGIPFLFLSVDRLNSEGFPLNGRHNSLRLFARGDGGFLTINTMKFGFERRGGRSREERRHGPLFFRTKGIAFLFPLADQPNGNRLHASYG